jgi:acyl-CoA reductase-like NAD-dependent aldehyde dehydrogenase
MYDFRKFYIDGAWVSPIERRDLEVVNPATERAVGMINPGSSADVDKAVKAARAAFDSFYSTSREERIALLQRIIEVMQKHLPRLGEVISEEMGAGYVSSGDLERARRVARKLRAGMIHINGAQVDMNAPFGGYKQSGNGREWGREGLKEFLETKAVLGHFAER